MEQRNLEEAINSVRNNLEQFKEEIRSKLADLQREVTEKLLVQRHELSERASSDIYDTKNDVIKNISAVQDVIKQELLSIKQEFNARIDSIIQKEIPDVRKEAREDNIKLEQSLTDIIHSRIRIVGGVSASIFIVLGWLWTYSVNTSNRVDKIREDTQREFSEFKEELKDIIQKEIQGQIWELKSTQQRILYILERRSNDEVKYPVEDANDDLYKTRKK